ncbi:MAG TPA: glycosyl hydrolase [Blastocatellia bacterium]|nr:glycosyl hydrolase [Blastocatellia bacterium]
MKTHIRFSCHAALVAFLALLAFGAALVTDSNSSHARQASQSNPLSGLRWRNIGPFRGGRSVAVAGVASQPMVYYFGGTGGGVFKTTDAGVTWEPVSDGQPFGTGTVGAIEVSESDPNVVYVGMGESCIRGNFSHGDGVYKSADAGKTWRRVGLEDSRIIGRIRIHPKNPDLVYVAALGHAAGPNDQRGVFRSKDGGKNWDRVLFKSNKAGAVDLSLDPSNPNVLYASLWEAKRTPYSLESGGPDSGLHKSTDGGDTWTEISRNPGGPKGPLLGRIGVAVSPANPERVWAIIEAEDGGVFRSDNGGKSWTKVNDNRNLRQRAWYYTHIYADPKSADTVYVLNTGFYKSIDGGRTYTTIQAPHGDHHDLWIAPDDPNRMINANDGGANVSFNGGKIWSEQDQATAQFYRVALDNDFPYHVYGAQQDNSTVKIAGRTTGPGITVRDWEETAGSESGWVQPHPKDSNIVFGGNYGGYLSRLDHRTGQNRNVTVWPENPMGWGAEGMKYRFQWNFPILFSPHDPNTLYTAGNLIFKTMNEGQSWQIISPDLTRNDKTKLGPSGGPITKDNTSVEYYCTIFTAAESPVQKGVIWAGSDDGLVHVTRDGGAEKPKWENVTKNIPGLPEWIQINSIEASPHDAATAYFAATMYKSDDFRPYLYKTSDYGKTWKKIVSGIPDDAFTRVIREDPNRRGLLYAGTETGIYVSFNDGENWQSLQLNLPVVPITDIAIHKRDRDLVVATQGRSFWAIDDLHLLHQWKDTIAQADSHLFKPEEAYRMAGGSFRIPSGAAIGENPPAGASIWYYLKDKAKGEVTIEILEAGGKLVKKFSSKAPEAAAAESPGGGDDEDGPRRSRGPARALVEKGLNRFVWDLRYPDAARFPGMILWSGNTSGPQAAPGSYQVKLTVDGKTLTESFEVRKDPRVSTTQEEFQKQFDLLTKIRDKFSETSEAIIAIRDVRKQAQDYAARVKDQPNAKPIIDAAKALGDKLTAIEEELYQTKNRSNQDPLNFPIRLNNKLAALAGAIAGADAQPTEQQVAVYEDITGRINAQLEKLRQALATDVPAFNKLVRDQNAPAVWVKRAAGQP